MKLHLLSLFASTAWAFKDTSPFFYLSTSPLPSPFSSHTLATASSIQETLLKSLSSCSTTTYIVVNQSGVSISDYTAHASAPYLRKAIVNGTDNLKSRIAIPEVHGPLDLDAIVDTLLVQCGASIVHANPSTGDLPTLSNLPTVVPISFDPLPHSAERHTTLANHDSFLHAILSTLPSHQSYTIIITTSPPDTALIPPTYSTDDSYDPNLHIEFKRDADFHTTAKNGTDNLPLFEKYVFLSPGLIMGFFVILPLLLLFYIALGALSSLKVSYFAFSKEMGPAAQRKAQ